MQGASWEVGPSWSGAAGAELLDWFALAFGERPGGSAAVARVRRRSKSCLPDPAPQEMRVRLEEIDN